MEDSKTYTADAMSRGGGEKTETSCSIHTYIHRFDIVDPQKISYDRAPILYPPCLSWLFCVSVAICTALRATFLPARSYTTHTPYPCPVVGSTSLSRRLGRRSWICRSWRATTCFESVSCCTAPRGACSRWTALWRWGKRTFRTQSCERGPC